MIRLWSVVRYWRLLPCSQSLAMGAKNMGGHPPWPGTKVSPSTAGRLMSSWGAPPSWAMEAPPPTTSIGWTRAARPPSSTTPGGAAIVVEGAPGPDHLEVLVQLHDDVANDIHRGRGALGSGGEDLFHVAESHGVAVGKADGFVVEGAEGADGGAHGAGGLSAHGHELFLNAGGVGFAERVAGQVDFAEDLLLGGGIGGVDAVGDDQDGAAGHDPGEQGSDLRGIVKGGVVPDHVAAEIGGDGKAAILDESVGEQHMVGEAIQRGGRDRDSN